MVEDISVPVIDLGPLFENQGRDIDKDVSSTSCRQQIVQQIVEACKNYGFFQVVNHNVPPRLIHEFRQQMKYYFEHIPLETKLSLYKRSSHNSRGFFNDELTKQKLDWKQCLDVGVPRSRNWSLLPDDDGDNQCMDGYNQFPDPTLLPNFRSTITKYIDQCSQLSHVLTILMTQGINPNYSFLDTKKKKDEDIDDCDDADDLVSALFKNHTSYLRMNYYPIFEHLEQQHPVKTHDTSDENETIFGISPHRDAGFLTVLLQDDDCHSLQVLYENNYWITIHPIPDALTINIGDMAQIWSNGQYQAPLHRVLTNRTKTRYSAPYFYNPPYDTYIQPIRPSLSLPPSYSYNADTTDNDKGENENNRHLVDQSKYNKVLWGYFRAVRFAGDYTDLGIEIQIDDFMKYNDENVVISKTNHHLRKQEKFAQTINFSKPFDVEEFRSLLLQTTTIEE
jgi:isopenicillin N synthase-like dioxygenase